MDTPEKTQISSSLSKFEDSPVFNYINSLSPIKPVKSIHLTQTFNPLNFASLPSIFTSPHLSSLKESRFLKRHSYTDPSKPELSSGEVPKISTNEEAGMEAGQLCDSTAQTHENFDPGVSMGGASLDLPRTLKYDCGSPNYDTAPCVIEADCVSGSTCTSLSIVPFVQEASEKCLSYGGMEVEVTGMFQTEQKRETIGCHWESIISDAADVLIFNSPDGTEACRGVIQQSLDPAGTRFCSSLISQFPQNDINEMSQTIVDSDEHRDPSLQTGEAGDLTEIEHAHGYFENPSVTSCMSGSLSDNVETGMCTPFSFKPGSNLHRGFRRRCLDFEMVAARRKNLDNSSSASSFLDNQLVPSNPGNDSLRRMLPGIGLHLNALALTSRDNTDIKHEILSSGTQKLSFPGTSTSILPPTSGQEAVHESLTSASLERETDPLENEVQLAEDASQAAAFLVNDEFNQNSPKKKRRRLEQAGENDQACKRCNCKKSKCLKLYCECFAAGVYCIEPCSCQDCFNKPIHEDTVLATRKQIESRNPLAFAPKVIRTSDPIPEVGDDSSKTPASARHKRGCNCKKSSCLKKYCECYQGGVGCSINCRCEGCKNAFGRKDGSAMVETEEPEEEETDPSEKNGVDKNLEKTDILNNEEQNPVSGLPTTPLQLCRPLVQLPFSSKSKPPRSFTTIGSSSTLFSGQIYGRPNIIRPQNIIEKHFQTVAEDEMPEILRGNATTPSTGIKTSSPNSKRISPPQSELGSTPGRRSGRKLILQSIPSFPSLTQH